jgi:predicted Zn-dependent peptidase
MTELITLANGARLVVDPMPGLETAAVGVWFCAGAMDERAEEHGVAHLLEHMAFKGTRRRSARQIADEIESVGGYLNASTGYSRTGYYARILKADTALALDLLADILTEPAFDAAELAKEQDVVIQEIGEAADQPDDAVMETLQRLAFGAHPLARPILGTEQSVMSHTPARLAAFMDRFYHPANMVIVACGAVDVAATERVVQDLFGIRPERHGAPLRIAARYVGGAAHDARDIEQTHIALGFPGAASRATDYAATRVFIEALGGGMSSRIFQKVREERGLAYAVYAFTDGYDDIGLSGAYVGADADAAPEAAAIIRAEIEDMAGAAMPAEVDRAKAMLKSTLLMGLESPSARCEAAASQIFTHGRLFTQAELAARIDAVGNSDVERAAAHALSAGGPCVSIVGAADFDAVRRGAGA